MYLRTIQRTNKDGSVVRYCQLAHNVRNASGQSQAEVVYSFGREDQLDRAALSRLVRSISRFLEPSQALAASAGSELAFLSSRPMGGAYVLDALWRRLGIDEAVRVAAGASTLPSSGCCSRSSPTGAWRRRPSSPPSSGRGRMSRSLPWSTSAATPRSSTAP